MRTFSLARVVAAALFMSTLSFAAGIAGDLSGQPTYGTRVVLRIPPPIPADAERARPLPPLVSTAAAEARTAAARPLLIAARTVAASPLSDSPVDIDSLEGAPLVEAVLLVDPKEEPHASAKPRPPKPL